MRFVDRHWFVALTAVLVAASLPHCPAHSQGASVSFTVQRPFVTSITPVIGPNGGIGGIDVDANGLLSRVNRQPNRQLAVAREHAIEGISDDVRRDSPMRKVSLPRLEAKIAQLVANRQPLTTEMLYFAGLQRIEYVFVYPELNDIVVAGPAGDWVLHGDTVVGASSGNAVLRIDDLLDALQSTAAAATGQGITCSINPAEEGMARLRQTLKSRNVQLTDASIKSMEQQLGDQAVTVTGIRPTSHFARVMVSADYLMKRIAMDLERSPVAGLPSYMQLLKRRPRSGQVSAPRWWLATDYESVQKSEDGLAWRFQGRGVRANSEHGYLNKRGKLINAGRPSPLAKLWADKFTDEYDSLAKELPVFGQLSGCVDLAVLAALISQEDLLQQAGCPLLWLTDPGKLTGEEFAVPKSVRSQARIVRGRAGWVVSVSGGIDLETGSILKKVQINPKLTAVRQAAIDLEQPWWWD